MNTLRRVRNRILIVVSLNFQSLSEPRSCQVRYEKRLTRVRRIPLFHVIRLGLSPGVAFSLPLRHGLSYMSIAECARLRLSFPYRNFQSLSEPRSCQVRYEKRLTRVRRILLFL